MYVIMFICCRRALTLFERTLGSVGLNLGSDYGRLVQTFLLRCPHHGFDRLSSTSHSRSEKPGHSYPSQGCQESDVSDPARASPYNQIEEIEAISVHVGSTDRSGTGTDRDREL